jgi:probable rRNA maturation factor
MSKNKDNAPAERPPGSQPIGMSRGQNLVGLPEITVRNLQRTVQIDVAALQEFAQLAVQLCFCIPRNEPTQLERLRKIFVLLISNRRMARIHRQFLSKVGPTDVMTFEHGEIFVSAGMARDQALSFGSSLGRELRLYVVHGLLHLHGFDDRDEVEARRMARMERQILAAALKQQL